MRCSRCEIEAEPGKQKCKQHLAEAVIQQSSRSKAWVNQGLCDRCGKREPDEGRKRCKKCREEQNRSAKLYQKDLLNRKICVKCCVRTSDATKFYCSTCVVKINADAKKRNQARKLALFDAYGGRFCACCGETELCFLSLDHIENDGAKHRIEVMGSRIGNIYSWLRKNKFPKGLQVLCMNCNFGKRINGGICPHKLAA